MARAHRTAAIGRSKDAKKPSPVVATSRPPKRASSPRGDRAVVQADHGGAIGPRCLEHGDGVAYLRLEVGELIERDWVGESRASAVEVDQPTQRAQPSQQSREVGEVPHCLDVMHPRVDQEQVQCSFADNLEGEMHVAVPRILGPRLLPHRPRS